MIEIAKFKKRLYIFHSYRNLLDIYHLDFFGVYFNVVDTNNKVKIFYTFHAEFIFFNINLQLYFLKIFYNFSNVFNIFELILRVNQNIIKISRDEIIKKIKENIINIALKYY
jgi:hypothetical protein